MQGEIKAYPHVHPYLSRNDPVIIIYRSHILKLKEFSKPVRDQLCIELATDMGLRSGEIATLRIENIDLRRGRILIVDSKRKEPYPIPLSYEIAQHVDEVKAGREEGWLIVQDDRVAWRRGKPITTIGLCWVWKKWARKARLPNWQQYNPRLGRHYFACEWNKRKGNIEILRRILRHKHLTTTQIYLSRLIFWEDEQAEYARIMEIPNVTVDKCKATQGLTQTDCALSPICKHYEEHDGYCLHQAVCKHFERKHVKNEVLPTADMIAKRNTQHR